MIVYSLGGNIMADQAHLERLRLGGQAWNDWQRTKLVKDVDLTNEVVKQPHDMPPSRFPQSPTSGHSSYRT